MAQGNTKRMEQTGLAPVQPIDMPAPVARRGITEAQWRTLSNSLFPGARAESVLMVWDYCKARNLDPLKKPCQIVPMEVKKAGTDQYEWRDVVMPGIYEYRTTAQRTGEYLGHSKPEYGESKDQVGVSAPEWCELTVYRWNAHANARVEYPVRVYFREVVALKGGKANRRWAQAPIQMLTKCTEAAALREAFPDEFGGEITAEEMDGQRAADAPPVDRVERVRPEGYDEFIAGLKPHAIKGEAALTEAFQIGSVECRDYLTSVDNAIWEGLKNTAIDMEIA